MSSARVSLVCVALLLSTAGCGGKASVNQASAPPCGTRVPASNPADTLTVVVFDKIDLTHAPRPQSRSERFVFSHLYETLVNIDCHGQVKPGVAKSWKEASDGWYIEIKEDAHFWDDTMVTADDVSASIKQAGLPIGPVDQVDETHVIIHGEFDVKLLALPMLAIRKQSASVLSVGTGLWEIDRSSSGSGRIVMRPASGGSPVVIFEHEDSADAMNLINGSADAMISDDPSVIDYARTKSGAMLIPLTWDKTYVLIDPVRVGRARGSEATENLPQTLLDALARDTVPGDARGGSTILSDSWNAAPLEIAIDDLMPSASPGNRILFRNDDPVARSLAERIVALAAMDTSSSVDARAVRKAVPGLTSGARATGMRPDEFARALALDDQNACYVVSLSWNADFPALASHFYHERANWLAIVGPLTHALIPLVETRSHFFALSNRIAFTYDQIGNVRLIPPGVERVR